ncbi:unnamed protein product [Rodentolepis nana]|uniref:HELICc2 domain-containing protein n=1 Tax=Rodentolepis nana TaxID=102285 RepID=A0A0R3TX21_RODNA|nr:unnamed protein product [Rodentolepis nana]
MTLLELWSSSVFHIQTGGQRFCEALCMLSVNQAIGCSIRYENNYAIVFLMDQRLINNRRLRQLLPSWAQIAFKPLFSHFETLKLETVAFFARTLIDAS